jgi:hypothetical protein
MAVSGERELGPFAFRRAPSGHPRRQRIKSTFSLSAGGAQEWAFCDPPRLDQVNQLRRKYLGVGPNNQ